MARSHFGSWKSSCEFIKARDPYMPYSMQFTVLSDFDEASLEGMMDIYPSYKNVGSYCERAEPLQTEYRVDTSKYPERSFCGARAFEGYSKPNSCSTSWATEAITIAERVLMDANYNVRLSVDYLIECLPKHIDGNSCDGYYNKDIFEFIADNGLISEDDAATLDDICSPPESMLYHFNAKEIECPNKGHLMNFIADSNHVDVMIALDLKKLRFVKEMDDNDGPFTGGTMQPTMWATVTGYSDKTDDEEENDESFWYMEAFVNPCERIQFKMPLRANDTTANYAGIAGYAYSLEFEGAPADVTTEVPTEAPTEAPTEVPTEAPTTEAPTTEAPTTEAPTTPVPTTLPPARSEIISGRSCLDAFTNLEDIEMITDITFEGRCEDIESLNFEGFTYLQNITIGTTDVRNALLNLKTLSIKGLEYLTEFIVMDDNGAYGNSVEACKQDTSVIIEDNPELVNIVFGTNSFNAFCNLSIKNNEKLKTLYFASYDAETGEKNYLVTGSTFYSVDSVVIAKNPNLKEIYVSGGAMKSFGTLRLEDLGSLQSWSISESGLAGRGNANAHAAEIIMKGM